MKRFEGKGALITGGGSGLGQAACERLAAEGCAVAVADINAEGAKKVAGIVKSNGGKAIAIEMDVTKEADNKRAVEETVKIFGRLDVIFTSAGRGGGTNVVDTSEEVWDEVMNLDLKGPYLTSKYAIPEMRKVGGGAIVHISSIWGLRGLNRMAPFVAAKGGVVQLTRHMSSAHAHEQIRVNCVCPAYIATPIIQPILDDPEKLAEADAKHPIGRIGRPEEVAAAVAFLASDDASFISGVNLQIDGGYLCYGA
jgi:NAD(P)-dependent dehydrogenase (short-subunit alcohol dehydrogenase family)